MNGTVINQLGSKVAPDADIALGEKGRRLQARQTTILLNKPPGFASVQPEGGCQAAVSIIRKDTRWREDRSCLTFHPGQLRGIAPAGRLDIGSSGLLVLTQDGRVARRLIGEDSSVDKEYLVRVQGTLDDAALKLLSHGLKLDGKPLKPAKVRCQNADQLCFVLREGKKRQIRRMCGMVGLKVVGLKRIRIGRVLLGRLPKGQWRYLGAHETF